MTKIIKILVHPSDAETDPREHSFAYLNLSQIVEFYPAENGFTCIEYNSGGRISVHYTQEIPDDLMKRINDDKNRFWQLEAPPTPSLVRGGEEWMMG